MKSKDKIPLYNYGVVLLSGGQDSFVSLLWAIQHFKVVHALSVDYQQKHKIEIDYAKKITQKYKIKHKIIKVGKLFSSITKSSLLDEKTNFHHEKHTLNKELPISYTPNRNGFFLSIASCYAHNYLKEYQLNHIHLVAGMCEVDYSGYPDCRDQYIKSKQLELSLGLDTPVSIHTPLMWKKKSNIWEMAQEMNILNDVLKMSMTCYNGSEKSNSWGKGCGSCLACKLRAKGYKSFLQFKKTK